ncbi:MAG: M28 family metallopeptidase [Candidatus Krumholzibacteria bacterium]|nr:M28 family metallopeptidase [Candidatus Krumholzibacteria bacterium]
MRSSLLFVACTLALFPALALAEDHGLSAARMHACIALLADDRLEGRAPGSRGEELALDYLVTEFTRMGYAPGNTNGTYVQEVPLVGMTMTEPPALAVRGRGGYERTFANGREFVGWTLRQQERAAVTDADMVFVGYGVVAPEYEWDDFRGADVRGKIIVMLVGDPPHHDPSLFAGEAMTYYGRWTYKFENAAEKGAAGAIIVHDTEAAGYPWAVVENSWSGEQFDMVRPDAGASRCALESWVTGDAARELFGAAGRDFDADKRAAASRDFTPVPLALSGTVEIHNRLRQLTSHNVVARLEGRDEQQKHETIIYTAHWDHLGFGKAVDGDSIYNGALDNASGVAGVLEVAHAFAREHENLARSVLFVLTTAEESGLLGAYYYADNPLHPLKRTVASINVDGANVWGRTKDMVVVGYGQSELDAILAEVVATQGRALQPDSEPEKGYYYRSDHFAFAKKGVPALYADSGVEFRGRPEGWGMERRQEYTRERYHKPQDEYDASWDLSGAIEDMTALYLVGHRLATSERYPQWSETSEFRRVREEMMKGSR